MIVILYLFCSRKPFQPLAESIKPSLPPFLFATCRGDTFSISAANLTCDACPTDVAMCDYAGKSDESVPVGSVIVPLEGYWQSSPLSPQIHTCPIPVACASDSWRGARTELVQYQKDLVYGNRTLNVTEYNQLQCAQGYTGEPGEFITACGTESAGDDGPC